MEEKVSKLFQSLLSSAKERLNEAQQEKLKTSFLFAYKVHDGQKRFNGDPYVVHLLETAIILDSWKMDTDALVAGLLHDSIEDANVSSDVIEKQFGKDVTKIVEGVTKVSHIQLKGKDDELFVENLRKMFLAMAKDLRVVIVKLADRLHNMRTLEYVPEAKSKRIAKETLEVYAPLAERLGMGKVKAELENLSFYNVYPEEYKDVVAKSKEYYLKAEDVIKKMTRETLKGLNAEKIDAVVTARKKHYYSLWKKLNRESIDRDYSKIHDIVAMRILVNEPRECYVALGIVHALFSPVPYLGVSDFIAQPKPNGYQSIHTKVFGPHGKIVEVQIRTHKMHEEAESGVAAHWAYSEAKSKGVQDSTLEKKGVFAPVEKLRWIKQLINWQKEIKDTDEYLNAVKFDALSERIYVYTPQSDVYDLPVGATPVDFTYAVHTKLGEYIKGVKVNGRMVPLNYKLNSGEVVEIIKSKSPVKPSKKWLEFVVTTAAKREIRKN